MFYIYKFLAGGIICINFFLVSSSKHLDVRVFPIFGGQEFQKWSISNDAVCRTGPATPGLFLNTFHICETLCVWFFGLDLFLCFIKSPKVQDQSYEISYISHICKCLFSCAPFGSKVSRQQYSDDIAAWWRHSLITNNNSYTFL